MNPGIYYDISFEDYLAIDAVNSGLLKDVAMLSLEHAKYNKEHPKESPALAKGKLFHTLVLQPEKFRSEYAIMPKVDLRTKVGKQAKADFLEEADGKMVVTRDDYIEVFAMRKRIYEHSAAIQFVQNGAAEVTCIWIDKETGLLCKARADYFHEDFSTIVDLKSTKDASPKGFPYEMKRYGYHVQAGFYTDGFKAVTGEDHDFVIVASEKTPPFCVSCFLMNNLRDDSRPPAIDIGRQLYRKALDEYAKALETGIFTGYGEDIIPLDMPFWS
jgi:exodeoxyribonuclease VIII